MKGNCFLPNCKENLTCILFDAVKMMTVGCGLNAVQLPFSAHFDPKLPEMFLSEGTTLRGPAKMHPPTYHLASLDPIEVYFNPKRLPLKADTDIFSIYLILPLFCDISPQSSFGNIQQIRTNTFCSECLFCLSAFIYLLRISVCSNLAGRQIQSWT